MVLERFEEDAVTAHASSKRVALIPEALSTYMSYSLNSLKGEIYRGLYRGLPQGLLGVIGGDTGGLDRGSCGITLSTMCKDL